MAKSIQSEFKFRKTDTIGAASAENDGEFLQSCFVETEEYEALKNKEDIRQIVLGRTGSGKSALLERLKQEGEDRVISIEPHNLALAYVSNSSVIKDFSNLGVNLDPFYKLLWRHVLTVEVLKKHFESHPDIDKESWWNTFIGMFQNQTREDKDALQAVEYLRGWEKNFWVETEYRVKEITTKMEEKLTDQTRLDLKSPMFKAGSSAETLAVLSDEKKAEMVNRGQRVVSEAQIEDLSKVQDLLGRVLTDRQKSYYILIDRLDENWVEEKLRYRLIMALLDSVREIGRVPNIRVLVAIRRDLIERVFRIARDAGAGFQEEKYQSLYLPLHWSPNNLIEILDKRINALVTRRYQRSKTVTHRDLLPKTVDKTSIMRFITDRSPRPRDVISFFNKCIEAAEGRPRLSKDTLKRAEGEYSRQRLRALGDEWHADYPGLLDFVSILKERPPSFSLNQVKHEEIEDLCLKSAIDHPDDSGVLREQARNVCDGLVDVNEFKRTMFMVFYRTGLTGLKLETFESVSWIDELGQGVSLSEINDTTGIVIHTTYRRALGIKERKRI